MNLEWNSFLLNRTPMNILLISLKPQIPVVHFYKMRNVTIKEVGNKPHSAGTDFIRQDLTSLDVRS